MNERSWDHWYAGFSFDLQQTAMFELLQDCEEDYVLTRFFEVYGLMKKHVYKDGTVTAHISEMPTEPTSFHSEQFAEDTYRFLDMVRSPEPPSFPATDLPAVADACIGRAMAYLELARTISAGELKFPVPRDPPRTDHI